LKEIRISRRFEGGQREKDYEKSEKTTDISNAGWGVGRQKNNQRKGQKFGVLKGSQVNIYFDTPKKARRKPSKCGEGGFTNPQRREKRPVGQKKDGKGLNMSNWVTEGHGRKGAAGMQQQAHYHWNTDKSSSPKTRADGTGGSRLMAGHTTCLSKEGVENGGVKVSQTPGQGKSTGQKMKRGQLKCQHEGGNRGVHKEFGSNQQTQKKQGRGKRGGGGNLFTHTWRGLIRRKRSTDSCKR